MDANFCIEALEEALKRGQPDIFNTDQGSQFTSREFIQALRDWGVKISMDGEGRYGIRTTFSLRGCGAHEIRGGVSEGIPGWTGRQEWTQGVLPILQQPTTPPGPG